MDDESHLPSIFDRNEIEYVALTGNGEVLYVPDDFELLNSRASTALDLINAQLAWNITTGSPNVYIGIVDLSFETTHEDLVNQIVDDGGMNPQTSNSHGTSVVGLAAAQTDNNKGIASIGFNSKMVIRANGMTMQEVYLLSQVPGVKVINMSWKRGCSPNLVDAELCKEIWQSGVVLVVAAGNGPNASNSCGPDGHGYLYPASYEHTISVGAINHTSPIGTDDPEWGRSNWKDVIPNIIDNPTTTSSLNDKVDVFAPGFSLYTTAIGNTYWLRATNSVDHGASTSFAAPIVSGTVALMFDANPNQTPDQVKDIIKSTAQDISQIPENGSYMTYLAPDIGRLNAYRAVLEAECMLNPNPELDLMVRNSEEDDGSEPDLNTEFLWQSCDIWVRNQNDGRDVQVNQNPEYDPIDPNYVYVRVTNNSCVTSSGNDILKLYWAKANTALYWDEFWTGGVFMDGVSMGDEEGAQNIPVLEPGQESIIEFEWDVPNPQDYVGINPNPWHFCLLSRIESVDDPMTFPEGHAITENVRNNNNIAWKNTTVVDIHPDTPSPIGGVVAVSNPFPTVKAFNLQFVKESKEKGKPIYEEAEVSIEMDSIIYDAWARGGKEGQNFDFTKERGRLIATSDNMTISKILFEPNEIGTVYLKFNFLTSKLTSKEDFVYHVIQRDAITDEIIGGESYEIRKHLESTFAANAGNDKEIDKNESVTILANSISGPAVYNWYDPEGNLIYTGTDLTVSPEFTQTYKLEIISELDGYKDYDSVEIKVNPYLLQSLVPNPASNSVVVNYDAAEATSAYLMVTSISGSPSYNYILDITEFETSLDITAYPVGLYSVALVCNRRIQQTKTLAKQ